VYIRAFWNTEQPEHGGGWWWRSFFELSQGFELFLNKVECGGGGAFYEL
jgi:hypothetical protein